MSSDAEHGSLSGTHTRTRTDVGWHSRLPGRQPQVAVLSLTFEVPPPLRLVCFAQRAEKPERRPYPPPFRTLRPFGHCMEVAHHHKKVNRVRTKKRKADR